MTAHAWCVVIKSWHDVGQRFETMTLNYAIGPFESLEDATDAAAAFNASPRLEGLQAEPVELRLP